MTGLRSFLPMLGGRRCAGPFLWLGLAIQYGVSHCRQLNVDGPG